MAIPAAAGAGLRDGKTAHKSSTAAASFAPLLLCDLICSTLRNGPKMSPSWHPAPFETGRRGQLVVFAKPTQTEQECWQAKHSQRTTSCGWRSGVQELSR
jgi:hypothetical protein